MQDLKIWGGIIMIKYENMVEGKRYAYGHDVFMKKNGILYTEDSYGWIPSRKRMIDIVNDMLFCEIPWQPMCGEHYCYPTFEQLDGYELKIWGGTREDNKIRKIVGVYKTSEEAIQKATELGWLE